MAEHWITSTMERIVHNTSMSSFSLFLSAKDTLPGPFSEMKEVQDTIPFHAGFAMVEWRFTRSQLLSMLEQKNNLCGEEI